MVGNDIVDLRDRDADSTRFSARFDARVFTERERRAIAGSRSGESERWRMWAAKEASYKLARKLDGQTIFSPCKFEVVPDASGRRDRARVIHGASSLSATAPTSPAHYYIDFDETPERVHAVAVSKPGDLASVLVVVGDRRARGESQLTKSAAKASESEAVRRLACDSISDHFELPRDQLAIHTPEDRIPRLLCGEDALDLSLSLSHHGRFIAFACSQWEAAND